MKDIKVKKNNLKISCIGAGYVGGPTMAVIADKCPHIDIYVLDLNKNRIKGWNSKNLKELPVFEPGLKEIILRTRGKNLFFTTDIEKNISDSDIVFLSVNTPTKTSGIGSGRASDLRWIEKCARQVADASNGHTIVIEKSTLPVRTASTIKTILNSTSKKDDVKGKSFSVLSNPEFLAEGTAINDLENPDRVLIGGEDEQAIETLADIYKNWVDEKKIIRTNLWSSELSKLTANAFLAQRITSINSVAAICEATGADVNEVSQAIGTDTRIGNKFLKSGPGFGGSCFKKDILNLVYLCRFFGLEDIANYWESVVNLNSWNQNRITEIVVNKLFGTLAEKKIVLLGFAFKANTNDTRESSAITIAKNLLIEGADLKIHDPQVSEKQISIELEKVIKDENNKSIETETSEMSYKKVDDIYDAFRGADAIIVVTEWDEYSKLDWEKISSLMRHPAWVFDTRSIVNKEDVLKTNINLWNIGIG